MPETSPAAQINRRHFLRLLAAVPVGAAVGAATSEVSAAAEAGIDNYTGRRAGSALEVSFIEDRCGGDPEPVCVKELATAPQQTFNSFVQGPLVEEAAFRAVPSYILNILETPPGGDIPTALEPRGDTWRLSRREAGVGMLAVIGDVAMTTYPTHAVRNWPIPIASALNGVANWWLQRRGGYQAAVAGNAAFTFLYRRRAITRNYSAVTRQ